MDGLHWTPRGFEYVNTYVASVGSNVGVVNFGCEANFGWFVWVVIGEVDGEVENTAFVWSVQWTLYGGLPFGDVRVRDWASGYVFYGGFSDVRQFFLEPLSGGHMCVSGTTVLVWDNGG